MDDQILNAILEESYTLHDLRRRVRILKVYLSKKLFGSNTTDDDLEIRQEIKWLSQLSDLFYSQITQSNFAEIFPQVEKKIESLNPLVIYFAFEPNQAEITSVGGWLRKNYGPQFIFDVKFDPNLIAGCAFVWKGIYRDYSLRSKIEANRQEIIQLMRNSIGTGK